MSRTGRGWLAPGILLSALAVSADTSAAAPGGLKQQCVEAYGQTQALRKSAHLRSARDSALTCAQAACPAVVKRDCAAWLGELEQSLPTVVLSARDGAGRETTAVRVFVDDAPFVERLDGRSVALDPGERAFRFELDGAPPRELRTLIREGEKNRPIEISFAPAPPQRSPEAASTPAGVFILGGVGVLALGSFATFALLGKSQKSDLESSCAPRCTDEEVGRVRTKLLIGDISLVTGIVALGAATTLFLLDRRAPSAPAAPAAPAAQASLRFDLHPLPGGAAVVAGGSF
jgi:hypothetical protein